jgi:hypothetical protein
MSAIEAVVEQLAEAPKKKPFVETNAPAFVRRIQIWAKHTGNIAESGYIILHAISTVIGALASGLKTVAEQFKAL